MDKQSTLFPRFLICAGLLAAAYFLYCFLDDSTIEYILLTCIALILTAIGVHELSETKEFNAVFGKALERE